MEFIGNKIAILGDMKELGQNSNFFHLNLKQVIEQADIDVVFTIGQFMKNLNKALSSNLEKQHFEDINEIEIEINKKIKSGDGILVKGSHSLQLNSLIKSIAGENYVI